MQTHQHQEPATARRSATAWKTFPLAERRRIDEVMAAREAPTCPRCGEWLAARPSSRIGTVLASACGSPDLECRPCRRFHPVLREEALYLYRVRRLATAVMRA
jgi:hypothetical protein